MKRFMIGACKKITPGGFCVRRKGKLPSMTAIKAAADRVLAGRIVRNKDVCP